MTLVRYGGVMPVGGSPFKRLPEESCRPFLTQLAKGLLWLGLVAVFYMAVFISMPGGEQGILSIFDKVTHVITYACLTLLGLLSRYAVVRLVRFLLLHGALIEIFQGLLTTHRTASLADWLADGLGIASMLLLAIIWRRLFAHRHPAEGLSSVK